MVDVVITGPAEEQANEDDQAVGELIDYDLGYGRHLGNRLNAIQSLLNFANSGTMDKINDLLRGDLQDQESSSHDARNACHVPKSCGNAASCMFDAIIDPVVMYGSSLLTTVGHCLSLPDLVQDFLGIIDAKG